MVKGKFYHTIVIDFPNNASKTPTPYNYITGQLSQIFHKCSVTTYKKHLIVIAPKKLYNEPLQFDRQNLYSLLERFDGYCCIGNCTKFLTSLRPIYLQTSACTKLGVIFREDKDERIFFYNDYCNYFYTYLCIEAAVKLHNYGAIAYLCTPGLIGILRYDRKNGTQLKETLQTYLCSNRNATLCAQKMFLHRNTINYRINTIEELLGTSLEDINLVRQLLFSLSILDYVEKYMGEDPLLSMVKLHSSEMPFQSLTD